MAWPTRSRCMVLDKHTNPASNVAYDVGGPASGKTWLVKMLVLTNVLGASKTMYVSIKRSGVEYQCALEVVPNVATLRLAVNLVLEAGDTLTYGVTAGGTGVIQLQAHGALLG